MVKLTFKHLLLTATLGLCLCFFSWESLAYASDLPPGVIVGDDSGIKADADGNYFIEHNDIKPGITFTKKITISNYSQEKAPFDLRLDMKGDKVKGEVNLLEAITVILTLEGKEIYTGDLSGHANQATTKLPLHLGKFKVGDTKVLEAAFKVSADLPTDSWKKASQADFYWVFKATREDESTDSSTDESKEPPIVKPKPPILPQTGEEWAFVIMGIIIGVFIVMISLIVAKKRRNNQV